jgi:hypothetical protein
MHGWINVPIKPSHHKRLWEEEGIDPTPLLCSGGIMNHQPAVVLGLGSGHQCIGVVKP